MVLRLMNSFLHLPHFFFCKILAITVDLCKILLESKPVIGLD